VRTRCRVPGLDLAVVPGDYNGQDASRVKPVEHFENRSISTGLGLDCIEEVARVDELVMDRSQDVDQVTVFLTSTGKTYKIIDKPLVFLNL
jgi:hypothetical protein